MLEGDKIKVAQGENPCYLLLNQANRHGLIAGASGTGKTVTMKVLAEGFAQAGVPVFMADVKGDVTGMAQPGDDTEKVRERAAALGAAGWEPRGCDVRLWDMLGGDGVPVRITISDMGPDLLARLRTDYVHEQQERYRTQIAHLEEAEAAASGAERTRATKALKKLRDQLDETTAFEEKVHHLADQMIEIDLWKTKD